MHKSPKFLFISFVCLFFSLCLPACNNKTQTYEPGVIKVGVLPDQSREQLNLTYNPLLQYLTKIVGFNFELVIPTDYGNLLDLFETKKIDLAYFGGYTFLKANKLYGAVPLVMRKNDLKFTSSFIAKPDDTKKIYNISDFKDKKFSFGSEMSTSGHLMPRYFLNEWNIQPEHFFDKVEYSGKHDKTIFLVQDEIVNLGVVNTLVLDTMFNSGRITESNITVIKETPPYTDYVWAVQPDLNKSAFTIILNAFLNLSSFNSKHQEILKLLSSKYYLPAGIDDFDQLNEAIDLVKARKIIP